MKIDISIPSWYTKTSEKEKPFTQYEVQIEIGEDRYMRKIRYSTFRDLHKKISAKHKNLPFPTRRIVTNNQHPRFIESRRLLLEEFLQEVVALQPIPHTLWSYLDIDTAELKRKYSKLPDMCVVTEHSSHPIPASILMGVCSGVRVVESC